jgi:hypothetical protein
MKTKNTEIRKGFRNEVDSCDVTADVYQDSAYSKIYCETRTSLTIDARGDRLAIAMTEYRFESNRETGASLILTRDEWNKFKKLILETGGEL